MNNENYNKQKIEGDMLRSYGRRKGKTLKGERAKALEEVMPVVSIKTLEDEIMIDPKSFFDFPVKEVWFEIGFGNGEHIVHQAENNPEVGIIGCEPFLNGVAACCKEISDKGVKNIRIWHDDARLLMLRMQPHSIDKLFLLHPDPWPKTRHHKRRFIQTESLNLISSLLKDDADFRMATDHFTLAQWMLEKTYFHPNFEWKANCAHDWQTPPDDWIDTRYHDKGKRKDHIQVFLNFNNVLE